jgi:polyhydroxybutyrate depolymerase
MSAVLLGMMLVLGACQASAGPQTQSVAGTSSVVPTAAASALCPTLPAAGGLTIETTKGSRRALVHLPTSTANLRPFPVVIVLHGLGDTSAGIELASEFSRKADQAGFAAVYPQALGNPSQWDIAGANDTAFIDSLLTELEHDPCVDPLRIYAAGISMGGGMVAALGCRLSDRIAAIASISGVYGPGWQGPCVTIRPMPVIAFHGVIDPLVPYAGGSIIGSTADTPKVVPVETWAAGWATRNHCKSGPIAQSAIGQVVPLFWQGCSAPVELYRINNGGHNWPGSALSSFEDPHTNLDPRDRPDLAVLQHSDPPADLKPARFPPAIQRFIQSATADLNREHEDRIARIDQALRQAGQRSDEDRRTPG